MELENYTLQEAIESKELDLYLSIAKALKPKNVTHAKEFEEQPFGLVKELQSTISGEDYDKMVMLYIRVTTDKQEKEITTEDIDNVMSVKFFDFFYQWNWIMDEIKTLSIRESNFLSHEPSAEEINAGIENLYKYGVFSTLDKLSGGDITKQEEIEKLPYGFVFLKLMYDKENNEFQNNYQRVMSRKK